MTSMQRIGRAGFLTSVPMSILVYVLNGGLKLREAPLLAWLVISGCMWAFGGEKK
jgi:hypothetical protein